MVLATSLSIYSPPSFQHVETQTGKKMMSKKRRREKDKKRKRRKGKTKKRKRKRPLKIINEKKRKREKRKRERQRIRSGGCSTPGKGCDHRTWQSFSATREKN